jgi:hypothetical protein
MLHALALICGGLTVLLIGAMAWLFWTDPERGLRETTHRPEQLPRVMADRYTANAALAAAFTLYGDLRVLAVFFATCAFIGFADGWIYARAGHPHIKHTLSGILGVVALGVCLAALAVQKGT